MVADACALGPWFRGANLYRPGMTIFSRALGGLLVGAALASQVGCNQTKDPAPAAATGPARPPAVTIAPVTTARPAATTATPAAGAPARPSAAKVVGDGGVAAWDALPPAEKEKLRGFGTLFLHQSVGQDLEDGAEAAGFKFSYYGPDHRLSPGLNGGIFVDVKPGLGNGNPAEKLAVFRDASLRNKAALRVVAMKFGYADVRASDLAATQAQYQRTAGELRGAGLRVLHVTPPLVFDVAENAPKMAMRAWMLATFAGDVIFDLQDIESLSGGARCESGGVWRICPQVRSTASCPSKGQGVDGDGAGHLCERAAQRISRAFLYAVHQAAL